MAIFVKQFAGEMQGSQFLMTAAIGDPGGTPPMS
jgi:hypothetical protein